MRIYIEDNMASLTIINYPRLFLKTNDRILSNKGGENRIKAIQKPQVDLKGKIMEIKNGSHCRFFGYRLISEGQTLVEQAPNNINNTPDPEDTEDGDKDRNKKVCIVLLVEEEAPSNYHFSNPVNKRDGE